MGKGSWEMGEFKRVDFDFFNFKWFSSSLPVVLRGGMHISIFWKLVLYRRSRSLSHWRKLLPVSFLVFLFCLGFNHLSWVEFG